MFVPRGGAKTHKEHCGKLQPLGLMDSHDSDHVLALRQGGRTTLGVRQITHAANQFNEAREVRSLK